MSYKRKKCGSVYLAKTNDDLTELESMYKIGKINGEDVRKINVAEIQCMEPNLNTEDVKAGLYSPNEYAVDPFLLPLTNLYTALYYGCKLLRSCKVIEAKIVKDNKNALWNILIEMNCKQLRKREERQFRSKAVINCAGNYSDEIDTFNSTSSNRFDITPAKGEYIVYKSVVSFKDRVVNNFVNCIPTKSYAGPFIFQSVYGHFVVGPTKVTQDSKTDRTCKKESVQFLKNYAKKHFPRLEEGTNCVIETYAGLRPQDLKNPDYDFRFDTKNMWVTLGAIRSTGLTASRAIAQYTAQKLYTDYNHIPKLTDVVMPPPVATKDGKWKIGEYMFQPTHKLSVLGLKNMITREHSFESSL